MKDDEALVFAVKLNLDQILVAAKVGNKNKSSNPLTAKVEVFDLHQRISLQTQ